VQLPLTQTSDQLARFKRIGLFDSGVGGLSVLRRLGQLPAADKRSFVYVGDTARCPYGNRPAEEIEMFVAQIITWMQRKEVDAIVMACNTSAAMARAIAERVANVPVFDLIAPTADSLANTKQKIGVMATASTARSQAFSRAIKSINPAAQVIEYGCPELVPIVESGAIDTDATRAVLTKYTDKLAEEGVELVVLGCTHFPFLKRELEKVASPQISFIDPAQILSGTNGNDGDAKLSVELFVTGNIAGFAHTAQICLGYMPVPIHSIALSELEACRIDDRFAISNETMTPPVVPSVVQ
jgi:glutamate racemase